MNQLVRELIDYRDYYTGVARKKLLNNSVYAEDLIQDLTIELLNNNTFDGKNVKGYLIKSIKNSATNIHYKSLDDVDILEHISKNGYSILNPIDIKNGIYRHSKSRFYTINEKAIIRLNKQWYARNKVSQFELARSIIDSIRN